MPSFLVLRPRPVQATRPIPAPRISLRRDPPAVAPPPETPPTYWNNGRHFQKTKKVRNFRTSKATI